MEYTVENLGHGITHIKFEYTGRVPEWYSAIEKDLLNFLFKINEGGK